MPPILQRLITAFFKLDRCESNHYARFLHRRVRCAMRCQHDGEHRYQFFDEVVSWTTTTQSTV